MRVKYSKSFKIQAVEKALNRSEITTLNDISSSLGIGHSTLDRWIVKARNHEFDTITTQELDCLTDEKRPQDWSLEERLNMVVSCAELDEEKLNAYCREKGVYTHHVKQWKLDFLETNMKKEKVVSSSELKALRQENKSLKRELNRKDKALAETAALLVLQKKVNAIWGNDEDDSQ